MGLSDRHLSGQLCPSLLGAPTPAAVARALSLCHTCPPDSSLSHADLCGFLLLHPPLNRRRPLLAHHLFPRPPSWVLPTSISVPSTLASVCLACASAWSSRSVFTAHGWTFLPRCPTGVFRSPCPNRTVPHPPARLIPPTLSRSSGLALPIQPPKMAPEVTLPFHFYSSFFRAHNPSAILL